jgi:hypothetical protein
MNETPTLIIEGYGDASATITRILSSSSAKRKNSKNHGTVILAIINDGLSRSSAFSRLVQGDKISIKMSDGEIIKDVIVRIEKENKPIISAWPKNEVGICLKKTKLGKFIGKVPEGLIKKRF